MKKAIVTGADGFIGSQLVKQLLHDGYDVFGVQYSKEDSIQHPNYHYVSKSFEEYDSLDFTSYEGSDLYHIAWDGVSGPKQNDLSIQNRNIEMAELILKKAIEAKLRKFIFAGSIFEYENEEFPTVKYDTSIDKVYSRAKLKAHRNCRDLSKGHILFNSVLISNIYGPGENSKRFINTLVRCMKQNEPMALTEGKQDYDFIYINDAIKAIILVGEKGRDGEEYYIGSNEVKPLKEYILEIRDAINKDYNLEFGKVDMVPTYFDYSLFHTNKLFEEFDFQCDTPFIEGIKKL